MFVRWNLCICICVFETEEGGSVGPKPCSLSRESPTVSACSHLLLLPCSHLLFNKQTLFSLKTQIQIHKYTITEIQIHKYTITNTQIEIHTMRSHLLLVALLRAVLTFCPTIDHFSKSGPVHCATHCVFRLSHPWRADCFNFFYCWVCLCFAPSIIFLHHCGHLRNGAIDIETDLC